MKKCLLLFCLLCLGMGCASVPKIDFNNDPQVREMKRLQIPPHPYRVSVAPLQLDRKLALEVQRGRLLESGEDVEKLSKETRKGEAEHRYSIPFEEDKFREKFTGFFKKQKIFSELVVQPQKKIDLKGQLKRAWDDNSDLLVQLKINRYEVYYAGINAWYVPNIVLWATAVFPAWFVSDEIYGAKIEVEAKVYSVHSGLLVMEKKYRADIKKNLDDFDRGYQILGIFRVPDSLGPSNWRSVEEVVMPYAMHEVKKQIYRDFTKGFQKTRTTPEFQASMTKQMALVMGVSRYKDFYIPKLKYAHQDGLKIYKRLLKGGYTSESAKILQDEYATLANVKKSFSALEHRARKQDSVVIYFSGRAFSGKDLASSYLLFFDSKKKKLKTTALSLKTLANWLKKIKSQKVILCLDTSFSGNVKGRSLKDKKSNQLLTSFQKLLSRKNLVILAGTSLEESAYELRELRGGIFSHCFLSALSGKGDINPKDGRVTLREMYDYVREEVPRVAGLEGLSQHPLWNGAISGEVVLFVKDKSARKISASLTKKNRGKIEGKVLGIEMEK